MSEEECLLFTEILAGVEYLFTVKMFLQPYMSLILDLWREPI